MKILITGATSGIGYYLARVLAFRNHKVYACCHTVSELERMALLKADNIEFLKLNVTDERDYEIISKLGIDCIVNQAGMGVGGSLLDIKLEDMKKNFETNVFGTMALTKYFLNFCFDEGRKGKILITSSLIGELPIPFMGSYAATKASLTSLTKILKKEIYLSNWQDMKVRLILPGAYHTGFNQHMLDYIDKSKYFKNSEDYYHMMRLLFLIIEKKKTRSIVNKMVKAIESNSDKLVYSAPCTQKLFVKIYNIFK